MEKKNYCDKDGLCTVGDNETVCKHYKDNVDDFGENFCVNMGHVSGTTAFACTSPSARKEAGVE